MKAVRNVATLMFSTVGGQVLTLATAPILARLFTPAVFGIAAFFQSLLMVIGLMVTLRYETAIPLSERGSRRFPVADRVTCECSGRRGPCLPVPASGAGSSSGRVRHGGVETLSVGLASLLGFDGRDEVVWQWMIRGEKYGTVAKASILQAFGRSGSAVGLGSLGVTSAAGLILANLIGLAIAVSSVVVGAAGRGMQYVTGLSAREVIDKLIE